MSTKANETRWQPRPPDPELEAKMLRRLMVRLGVEESRAKALIATEKAPNARNFPVLPMVLGPLILEEAFDRAWRRVGLALDRIGLPLKTVTVRKACITCAISIRKWTSKRRKTPAFCPS